MGTRWLTQTMKGQTWAVVKLKADGIAMVFPHYVACGKVTAHGCAAPRNNWGIPVGLFKIYISVCLLFKSVFSLSGT